MDQDFVNGVELRFFTSLHVFSSVLLLDADYLLVSCELESKEVGRLDFQEVRAAERVNHLLLATVCGDDALIILREGDHVDTFSVDSYEIFVFVQIKSCNL